MVLEPAARGGKTEGVAKKAKPSGENSDIVVRIRIATKEVLYWIIQI